MHATTQCGCVTYALFTCKFMLAYRAMAMCLCIHHKAIKEPSFSIKVLRLKDATNFMYEIDIYFFRFCLVSSALICEQKTVRECVRSCKIVERLIKNKIIKFMHMFVESICCDATSFDWCGNYRFDYKIYL